MRARWTVFVAAGLLAACAPPEDRFGGLSEGPGEEDSGDPLTELGGAPSGLESDDDQYDSAATGEDSGAGTEPDEGPAQPLEGPLLQFEGAAPTNVLLISIDTLRKDAVGRYSQGDSATPTLDRLLDEGVALDDHRGCSNWTYPSMLCALTGLYNLDYGYVPAAGSGWRDIEPIRDDGSALSQRLSDAGYRTGFVSTNPFLSVDTGFHRVYDDMRYDSAWTGDQVVASGLELLDGYLDGGAPWLLHLHFLDPHAPYAPPRGYYDGAPTEGEFDLRTVQGVEVTEQVYPELSPVEQEELEDYASRMYRGEVAYTDAQIKVLLAAMDERGALEDTLVVLFSDHGEQLFQRGDLEHGKLLHSEESDAVAGFWARDIVPHEVGLATSHRDLAPTVLAALGLDSGYREGLGRALHTDLTSQPMYAMKLNGQETLQSVDLGSERLIYRWDGALEYYDLADDPGELDDRYAPDSERVQALWELLADDVGRLAEYEDGAVPRPPVLAP